MIPASDSTPPQGELNPSGKEVENTLFAIERSSLAGQVHPVSPQIGEFRLTDADPAPGLSNIPAIWLGIVLGVAVFLGWAFTHMGRKIKIPVPSVNHNEINDIVADALKSWSRSSGKTVGDPALQAQAEGLLQRVAGGDIAASAQVLAQSEAWVGKTERTPKAEQWIATSLNRPEMDIRQAAIRATLTMDGVHVNQAGMSLIEGSVGNPTHRIWALWMLGALGNLGVNPDHAVKIITAYLTDTDANVRAGAAEALALAGTDETIPTLLDRFRNDPSPVVQERAACGLAEAGMYTQAQRTSIAGTLVDWLDDSRLSPQQRMWTVQALRDISRQNFGTNSAAWHKWYEGVAAN